MNTKNPKVSVLMPNYNCEKYLPEAIESILSQSFTDFEFIIVDDGSSDGSWEIIEEYAQKDKRIVAVKNEKNLKICKTLNKWIALARWEYIARMDSDDISMSDRFEKQVAFLDKHTNTDLVWTNCIFIDENWTQKENKIYPESNTEIKNAIWQRNPLLHPSVMLKREILRGVGWYREDMVYAEDLDLWIRLWVKYNFYNIQENLLFYRIFGSNATLKKQSQMIRNTLKVRKEAQELWYKISVKWRIYYFGTWCMQFLPPKFVLWLFNKIT